MRFRLTYEGELRPTGRDPVRNQPDPIARHKQEIRRHFHRQLRHLWSIDKYLREARMPDMPEPVEYARPVSARGSYYGADPTIAPMSEVLAKRYQEFGYRFVPLVRDEMSLLCSLRILFLRRDIPGSALSAGDIDNRLKTVIDALRRPNNARELAGTEVPGEGEDPFYCLLEDDKQVSHLEVETDTLLDEPTEDDAHNRMARLVITVEIRPYFVTMENLSFS